MRKLASIQRITELTVIPNADNIDLASILGWKCIVKKNEFQPNELAVYIEIDSVLPEREPFMFLASKKFRVKTWKLNKFGVVSQGIIFPLSILPPDSYTEGQDVTEIIGVTKFEDEEIPTKEDFDLKKGRSLFVCYMMRYEWFRRTYMKWFVNGKENKGFPSFISKTDETRIQALSTSFENEWKNTSGWHVTEKCEGQSLTSFLVFTKKKKLFGLRTVKEKTFGVCSRSIYLKTKYNCNWWNIAIKEDIEAKLRKVPFYVAIQGETCGPGIQGNIYNFTELKLFVFNVKNLNTDKYLTSKETVEFCKQYGFTPVPCIYDDFTLPNTLEELVSLSNGNSVLAPTLREGLVFRKNGVSFKVVSPEYLLKHGK